MINMNRYGIIYKIQNKVTNKIYIGLTTRSLKERIEDHKLNKSLIGFSIRKYGINNFIFEEEFIIDVSKKNYFNINNNTTNLFL